VASWCRKSIAADTTGSNKSPRQQGQNSKTQKVRDHIHHPEKNPRLATAKTGRASIPAKGKSQH
jgi:hypothetical protein